MRTYPDGILFIPYFRSSNMYWLMRCCKWTLIGPWLGMGYKTRKFRGPGKCYKFKVNEDIPF